MGEGAAKFLNDPNSFIVHGDDELASAPAPIQPHWDPLLKSSRALRRDLISKLSGAGLITRRKTARCQVGVPKKDGHTRLVLDCRATNQLHRKPLYSNLATVGVLADLCLSDEWIEFCESDSSVCDAGDRGLEPVSCCGAGIDMLDSFYPGFRTDSQFVVLFWRAVHGC